METAKQDAGKNRLELVPPIAIESIGLVRTYGTEKYGDPENWREVSLSRYIGALMRHLCKMIRDPWAKDDESGLYHADHVLCNAAFIVAKVRGEGDCVESTKPKWDYGLAAEKAELERLKKVVDDTIENLTPEKARKYLCALEQLDRRNTQCESSNPTLR